LRLLVVEDELILLRSLVQALREEGYAVDEASDGKTGHFKATSWEYDAIVLDWMLPEMSGVELLRNLRKTKATPVLLLTARDSIQDRVFGLDQGADDYLVKPFELKELLARVRALIRRTAGQATNEIRIGDLQIDIGCKKATIAGEDIALTAREYALLEMLALNRGKLVTRTMIYDHIFGEEDDTLSNIVDVHVSHLRKKIGRELIETRRGQGYILHG
jgi:two-component system OmpR family response regulator